MKTTQVVIEDWDGDGAIRIPDEVLQELGVDVGDSLYLIEEYVGTARCLVLSKSPQIPDRVDELVSIWEASAPNPPAK
jgi:antitoxin component of MazEF toxin-antitoxin module